MGSRLAILDSYYSCYLFVLGKPRKHCLFPKKVLQELYPLANSAVYILFFAEFSQVNSWATFNYLPLTCVPPLLNPVVAEVLTHGK